MPWTSRAVLWLLVGWFWTTACLAQPLVLVVEGVNPYRMLGPWLGPAAARGGDLETGYLERSHLVQTLSGRLAAEVRRMDWSGIPTDPAGFDQAVSSLRGELTAAREQGRPVYLVSHSLGSVIAVLALAGIAHQPGEAAVSLITLSSPLGRPQLLTGLVQFHPRQPLASLQAGTPGPEALGLARWLNIYARNDPLAGLVAGPGMENWELRPGPQAANAGLLEPLLAHILPFRDPNVAEKLLGTLVETNGRQP